MNLVCPHCKKVVGVGHLEWESLKCLHCGKFVKLGNWLVPIKDLLRLTKRGADLFQAGAISEDVDPGDYQHWIANGQRLTRAVSWHFASKESKCQ